MKNPLICCSLAIIVAFSGTVWLVMVLLAAGLLCSPLHTFIFTAGVTVFKACLLLCSFWLCCQIIVKRNIQDSADDNDICKK